MSAKWEKTAASKVLDVQKHQHGFSGNQNKRRVYTKISSTMQSRKQKENTCPTEDHDVPDMSSQASLGLVKGNEKKQKHKRTASLTDLRPEDKKKVANLIQELASLGAQKEEIETKKYEFLRITGETVIAVIAFKPCCSDCMKIGLMRNINTFVREAVEIPKHPCNNILNNSSQPCFSSSFV